MRMTPDGHSVTTTLAGTA
ncbi:Hypothetical protein PFREUD_18130 [Propionibacterium freudenreichii subsp. shermanii CIRM-BIA1]|uniref:Uncharacterized protein n=1 Tax=Propionibacterium freudenreichii subsp. shermanii (strain ATCC 9614 / DSM 4902 / CIP 103027 / NCIMB 8099 / CIRM-BIA1) TaxID=754252 RepID=D7GFK9_PROFC|nr:Hypothetical protein PFREUD_18130 [Propionibacterium freudenreichii subsp. shermanii CIRM-BIA1]